MERLEEVEIDEMRLPRIFSAMRRGGLYSRCRCAGCPPCLDAARRLLRGIANSSQTSSPYRPERWGDRYRTLSRTLGPRVVSVLTDMSATPTVVDVNVRPAEDSGGAQAGAGSLPDSWDSDAGDGGVHGELPLNGLLAARIPAALRTRDGSEPLKDLVGKKGIPGVPSILFKGPFTVGALNRPGALDAIHRGPGLYLAQWGAGQYLGMAHDLRTRIPQHLEAINRFVRNARDYRFYIAPLGGDPRPTERRILEALVALVGTNRDSVASRFARLGMTNRQREVEFF